MSGSVASDRLVALPRALCPVCGNSGDRAPAGSVQRQPPVELLRCSRCSAVSVDHVPDEGFLERLYDPAVYSSSLISHDRLRRRCARNLLRHFKVIGRTSVSILDYGGNDGSLARTLIEELRRSGYRGAVQATVVDLHVRPAETEIRFQGIPAFLAGSERYDIVLASAVLEHIPHLRPVLQRLFKAINPEGVFYSRTPYDVPIGRILPMRGMKWPRHFHDLGPDFWNSAGKVFAGEATMVASRTSIVESSWNTAPLQTFLAMLLKFPSTLETRYLMPWLGYDSPKWRLVGGWEVIFKVPGRPGVSGQAGISAPG